MPKERYKPEQIVTMRQIEVAVANGKSTPQRTPCMSRARAGASPPNQEYRRPASQAGIHETEKNK